MLQCIQHFPGILEPVEETLEKRPRRGNSETYLGMVVCITALKRLKPIWDSSQNKIKCIIIYLSVLAGSPSPSYVTKEDPPDPVCSLFRYSEPFRNLICITAGMSLPSMKCGQLNLDLQVRLCVYWVLDLDISSADFVYVRHHITWQAWIPGANTVQGSSKLPHLHFCCSFITSAWSTCTGGAQKLLLLYDFNIYTKHRLTLFVIYNFCLCG